MHVREAVRIRIWLLRTVLALMKLEIKGCEFLNYEDVIVYGFLLDAAIMLGFN